MTKKEEKDLALEDMKAQRELKLIGAKYGFESEQFKEKLAFEKEVSKNLGIFPDCTPTIFVFSSRLQLYFFSLIKLLNSAPDSSLSNLK